MVHSGDGQEFIPAVAVRSGKKENSARATDTRAVE
jgi:hypothetical protein